MTTDTWDVQTGSSFRSSVSCAALEDPASHSTCGDGSMIAGLQAAFFTASVVDVWDRRHLFWRASRCRGVSLSPVAWLRLADFGEARFQSEGMVSLGSLNRYSSPERLRDEVPMTASDVWSAGVTLYELLLQPFVTMPKAEPGQRFKRWEVQMELL
ncbi:unnamed protein product, partial [Symbiodinium sp. CCMP2592]